MGGWVGGLEERRTATRALEIDVDVKQQSPFLLPMAFFGGAGLKAGDVTVVFPEEP